MNTHPVDPIRSERGVALIIVLLLLAVMAGLTTGLTLNSQTEISMASNEVHYAGARAAAEAGMNRAIELILADEDTDLLATGTIPGIGNGPFDLTDDYQYRFEMVDDDDPVLYGGEDLSEAQLDAMGENGNPDDDDNQRLILRAIGTGPRSTTVTVARILTTTAIPDLPTTTVSNPAILVNGDLDMTGTNQIIGDPEHFGDVHANGNVTKDGASGAVTGDLTATGTMEVGTFEAGGVTGGGFPAINVPDIKAADYIGLADWILSETGDILHANGDECTSGCPTGWTYDSGSNTWSASGSMPTSATYYVRGSVTMKGTGMSSETGLSLIAEGSITLSGNSQFKPENDSQIQFVANGDLSMGVDSDSEAIDIDGQILVREQLKIHGNASFQGRVVAQSVDGATNAYHATDNPNGRRGDSILSTNSLNGGITVRYTGSLGDIVTTIPGGPPTYNNNILGWLEQ
jgi:hypothetical protein